MPQYKITPWKYTHELIQVRREIYRLGEAAPPADLRRHAVDRIAAWKMRGHTPHAVESTALLMDAILLHEGGGGAGSQLSVRAAYSAAFCRFVTGFCDIEQRTRMKVSMVEVARSIDMPASFVELRHEATHEELPSLQRLARNAKLGIEWLWHYYWFKLDPVLDLNIPASQPEPKASSLPPMPTYTELREILRSFVTKRKAEIRSGADLEEVERTESSITLPEIVNRCMGRNEALTLLTAILLEERMLIPAKRNPGDSMEGAITLWNELLARIAIYQRNAGFLQMLVERFMFILTTPSTLDVTLDAFKEAVHLWVIEIFSSEWWRHSQLVETVEGLRGYTFNECIMTPNYWSMKVAKRIYKHGDSDFKIRWRPLLELGELQYSRV